MLHWYRGNPIKTLVVIANSGNWWLKSDVGFYYNMTCFLFSLNGASERASPWLYGLSKPESWATARVTEMTCQERSAVRWVAGDVNHGWAALQKQLSRASCCLSEHELAGLNRLAPKGQQSSSASLSSVYSEAASAPALGGLSVGCAEAMEKLRTDWCCQPECRWAVSRWDWLFKNYLFVNNWEPKWWYSQLHEKTGWSPTTREKFINIVKLFKNIIKLKK